jgi:hypothetical protein
VDRAPELCPLPLIEGGGGEPYLGDAVLDGARGEGVRQGAATALRDIDMADQPRYLSRF